jgi:hypothetical protein
MKNKELSDRFQHILDVFKLNANTLAEEIGGTAPKYYKILKGEVSPNYDTIMALLNKYPQLSAEWFMRGEGNMILNDLSDSEKVVELEAKIAELEGTISIFKTVALSVIAK